MCKDCFKESKTTLHKSDLLKKQHFQNEIYVRHKSHLSSKINT